MENNSSAFTTASAGDHSREPTAGPFRFDDPTHRLAVGLGYLFVAIAGVIGNGFLLFAVTISRKLHTITNVFVVNLSISDLIGCATLPLLTVAYVTQEFPYSDGFCAALSGVLFIMFPASVVNLTLIAINRYTLITKSKATFDKIYTRRNITLMLISSWLYVVVVIFGPPAFGVGALGFSETYRTCTIDSENPLTMYYVVLRSALLPVAGIAITTTCYIGIYRFVTKAARRQRKISTTTGDQINKRQLQVTKNLFIIACIYILCITPYVVVYAVPSLRTVLPWGSIFYSLNSCINPIVYGLWHPNFNEIFRLILKCRFGEIPQKTRFLKLLCKTDPGKLKAANQQGVTNTTSGC